MFVFKIFLWLLGQFGILGFEINQLLKVLCVLFKNRIYVLLGSYVSKSTQKMLSQEIILCFYIIQCSFVLFIESFVLFEGVVDLIVFLMKLESVLHDEFFSFSCLFEVGDLHLCSKFLKLSSWGDEIVFEWLYDFLTVFDGLFKLLNLFELHFKSFLEGIKMLWLLGLFGRAAIDTVIKLGIIKRSKQFLNLFWLVIAFINSDNLLIVVLKTFDSFLKLIDFLIQLRPLN